MSGNRSRPVRRLGERRHGSNVSGGGGVCLYGGGIRIQLPRVLLERHTERASFAASGERLELDASGDIGLAGTDDSFVRVSGTSKDGRAFGRVIAREVRMSEERMSARGATMSYQDDVEQEVFIKAVSADQIEVSDERAELRGGVRGCKFGA